LFACTKLSTDKRITRKQSRALTISTQLQICRVDSSIFNSTTVWDFVK